MVAESLRESQISGSDRTVVWDGSVVRHALFLLASLPSFLDDPGLPRRAVRVNDLCCDCRGCFYVLLCPLGPLATVMHKPQTRVRRGARA